MEITSRAGLCFTAVSRVEAGALALARVDVEDSAVEAHFALAVAQLAAAVAAVGALFARRPLLVKRRASRGASGVVAEVEPLQSDVRAKSRATTDARGPVKDLLNVMPCSRAPRLPVAPVRDLAEPALHATCKVRIAIGGVLTYCHTGQSRLQPGRVGVVTLLTLPGSFGSHHRQVVIPHHFLHVGGRRADRGSDFVVSADDLVLHGLGDGDGLAVRVVGQTYGVVGVQLSVLVVACRCPLPSPGLRQSRVNRA